MNSKAMEMLIILINSIVKFFKLKKQFFFYLYNNLATQIEKLLTAHKDEQFNPQQNPCVILSLSKVPLCIRMIYRRLKVDYKISSVCLPPAILDELFRMHPSHQFAETDRNNKEEVLISPAGEETYLLLSTFLYITRLALCSLTIWLEALNLCSNLHSREDRTSYFTKSSKNTQAERKPTSLVGTQSFLEFKGIFYIFGRG